MEKQNKKVDYGYPREKLSKEMKNIDIDISDFEHDITEAENK